MKKKLLACGALLLAVALPGWAAKEYTPEELRQMVGSGTFPPQHEPAEETRAVAFPQCKAVVRSLMSDVQPDYPVRTLTDAPAMLSVQLWTNDAAVVMSCSQDGRLVVQKSSYR
jgi:hypothetical protein